MVLEAGVQLGDFVIEDRLGAGGMGIVYRARQLSLNRIVALKILGSALDSDDGKARFRREAQAVAKLNHPGIASIYFIGQDQQVCFLAMEFIDGVSIRKVMERLIANRSPRPTIGAVLEELRTSARERAIRVERFDELTVTHTSPLGSEAGTVGSEFHSPDLGQVVSVAAYIRRCCEIVRDAANALSHAHERGVVHRDVKPENLLLDWDAKVHIVDFGLARFYEDMTLTNTGSLVGTPMYMSPEQITGRFEVDHRTDLYSLGLLLYEMLTLRRPIEATTREGILRQVATKSRPPLSRKNRSVTRALESVVHKAIAHDPDERYQSAGALASDLQNVLDNKPVIAPPYRHKADLREIAAERPHVVTLVSVLLMAITMFIIILISLSILSSLRFTYRNRGIDLIENVGVLLALAVLLVPSICLYLGYNWTRWVISIFLILCLAYYLWNWAYYPSIFGHGLTTLDLLVPAISITCVAGIIFILHRRETRHWVQFARHLRAEQRGELSVGQ